MNGLCGERFIRRTEAGEQIAVLVLFALVVHGYALAPTCDDGKLEDGGEGWGLESASTQCGGGEEAVFILSGALRFAASQSGPINTRMKVLIGGSAGASGTRDPCERSGCAVVMQ